MAPRPVAPPVDTRPPLTDFPYGKRVYLPLAAEPSEVSDVPNEPDFLDHTWSDGQWLAAIAQVRTPEATHPIACDAGNLFLRKGTPVVLEFERGIELGTVTSVPRRQMVEGRAPPRIARVASESDLRQEARTRLRQAEATRTAIEAVRKVNAPAKVVRAEVSQGGNRVVVYLASEERIELRDVARVLTQAFKGRVEIRNVGVRDAARTLGGVGPCGLQLCCNTFLSDFAPVSIRQAKDQGLALNPQRVSGVCGRLMCCLVYEDAFYRQQRAQFPKQGKRVMTPKGEGRVRDLDVLARTVRVAFPDGSAETYPVAEVQALTGPLAQKPGGPPAADEAADDEPETDTPEG